jgi:hypothetical protein
LGLGQRLWTALLARLDLPACEELAFEVLEHPNPILLSLLQP